MLEANPGSLDVLYPVDTYLTPKPNEPLRFPKGTTRVVKNEGGENADKIISDALREMGAPHVFKGGESYSTTGQDVSVKLMAAEMGVSFGAHSDMIHVHTEGVTSKQDRSFNLSARDVAQMSENARLRIADNDRWLGASVKVESDGLFSGKTKRFVKKTRPGADPRQDTGSLDSRQLAARAVPASPEQLQEIVKNSPYTKKSKKSVKQILNLLDEIEIDWDRQQRLQEKVAETLDKSPGLASLIAMFDIPPMFATQFGLREDSFSLFGELEAGSWYGHSGGVYAPSYGFIAFPKAITSEMVFGSGFTQEYIIRHELGHAIHAMAKKQNKSAFNRQVEDADRIQDQIKEAGKWAAAEGKAGRSSVEINEEVSKMVDILSDEDAANARKITEYAATNRAEYVAEVIAHATSPSAEGLRKIDSEHYKMLSEFLGIEIDELKRMGL
jgi:hypothetical protein